VKSGDIVTHKDKKFRQHGVGFVVRTTPMYAYIRWSSVPSGAPFMINKEFLKVLNESR
jgi:hypothetical protein